MLDYKKQEKHLYPTTTQPSIRVIPRMTFLAVDGRGDPNDPDGAYDNAVESLYAVAYTLKMSYKGNYQIPGFEQYVVPPLEGLWWLGESDTTVVKANLRWTSMLRLPDFIRSQDVSWAIETASAKKKQDFSHVRMFEYDEGMVVQALHRGSYDTERDSLIGMEMMAAVNHFRIDHQSNRTHHEIYMTDPSKTAPEKTKVILRLPLTRATGSPL